eukprot:gene14145-5143_t
MSKKSDGIQRFKQGSLSERLSGSESKQHLERYFCDTEMGNGKGVAVLTRFVIFLVFAEYILVTFACGVGKGSYTNKEFPPLRENQRKPQEDEESSVASGPFNHKVRFGSKEFKAKIVRYFGTNIVFRDDEGNGADRYMTKRCERALKKLAKYVRVKWHNKVKVRVIEAWDEDGEHPPRSLHYEGRAIDITTSDRDRKKYGALASLAYFKAEFDWVAYLDGHVHVSCKRAAQQQAVIDVCETCRYYNELGPLSNLRLTNKTYSDKKKEIWGM